MNIEIPNELKQVSWRVENLYKIVDKNGRLSVFRPNPFQIQFQETRARRNIILKARQLGFTTQACIEMLDACLFNTDFNAVIIAQDLDSLKRIFQKVKVAWDNFNPMLKAALGLKAVAESGSEMRWNNGSRIAVTLSSRSDTVHWLHISEFGKICKKFPLKAQEIITGALPSVPSTGRITIESTAEGEDGAFYDMFWDAWERGVDPRTPEEFKAFFFPWHLDKTYQSQAQIEVPKDLKEYQSLHNLTIMQIVWYYVQKRQYKELMMQEYPTTPEEAFLSSGRKIFSAQAVALRTQLIKKLRESGDWQEPVREGDWVYFAPYKRGHRYGIGVDVGGGVGLDHSAIVIIDFSTAVPSIVARYKSNRISPEMLPYEIVAGATRYGNPIVAVERNNMGHTTLTILRDMYHNLYTEVVKDRLTDKTTERLGFLTTRTSKARIIFNFKRAFEIVSEDEAWEIDVPDEVLLREARKFDHEDLNVLSSKTNEETTRHFDVLIAACIAYEMGEYAGTGGVASMQEPAMTDPHRSMQ